MDRCHTYKGHFIPGCIGTAAALGCGKTLTEVKEYCTCEEPSRADLEGQIYDLKRRVENLEIRLLKKHEL